MGILCDGVGGFWVACLRLGAWKDGLDCSICSAGCAINRRWWVLNSIHRRDFVWVFLRWIYAGLFVGVSFRRFVLVHLKVWDCARCCLAVKRGVFVFDHSRGEGGFLFRAAFMLQRSNPVTIGLAPAFGVFVLYGLTIHLSALPTSLYAYFRLFQFDGTLYPVLFSVFTWYNGLKIGRYFPSRLHGIS